MTIRADLFTASRIWRLRFSVMDANRFDQKPCGLPSLRTDTSKPGWVQTVTGKAFYPLKPDPSLISIEDIAWALSMQCRFAGHVLHFYSVAEHCVYISNSVPMEDALWGLLHDATEAYLTDVPRPLKPLMPRSPQPWSQDLAGLKPLPDIKIAAWQPEQAYKRFKGRFLELFY